MFSDPKKNVEQLRLSLGAFVADFGSGSGHYIQSLREAVGESGKVFAVDVQKDLLLKIKQEAQRSGYTNIEIVWGDLEKSGGSNIRDKVLDAVIISNLLFQVQKKNILLEEIKRVLKSGGVLLVIDWTDSFSGIGPHPDAVISKENAKQLIAEYGFTLDREIDAGTHHYGLIYKKHD